MKPKSIAVLAFVVILTAASTASAASPMLQEMERAFVKLAEEIRPFVVCIEVTGPEPEDMLRLQSPDVEEFFKYFNIPVPEGRRKSPRVRRPNALGSGFIYDKEGHIITNNHVVDKAEELLVRMWDGEEYKAEVIGTDPDTDLAIIKIDADRDLPVARLGDSGALKVGQLAIAVGSPHSLDGSFSFGHITALGRKELYLPNLRFEDFVQTDAAINLGNSGGPLCNIDGEVIGINIAIAAGENLGFAIPSNTAREVIPQLISEGKVVRGYLGVEITDVAQAAQQMDLPDASDLVEALGLPDEKGAYVHVVTPGTPAEKAGLQDDDVIRMVNGKSIDGAEGLVRAITNIDPGASVMLEVWRQGKPMEI